MSEKQKGVVKFFDSDAGWGFITLQDGRDIFVHVTDIVPESEVGWQILYASQIVEFEIGPSRKGPKAINVRVLAD